MQTIPAYLVSAIAVTIMFSGVADTKMDKQAGGNIPKLNLRIKNNPIFPLIGNLLHLLFASMKTIGK